MWFYVLLPESLLSINTINCRQKHKALRFDLGLEGSVTKERKTNLGKFIFLI